MYGTFRQIIDLGIGLKKGTAKAKPLERMEWVRNINIFYCKTKAPAAYKLFGAFEYISITDESMMSLSEKALVRSFSTIFMINVEPCA